MPFPAVPISRKVFKFRYFYPVERAWSQVVTLIQNIRNFREMAKKEIPSVYRRPDLLPSSPFWTEVLARVVRPAARKLIGQLDHLSPLGIPEGARGVSFGRGDDESTMDTLLKVKSSGHENKIVTLQVGEFFEFFLIDAVVVVEATGINSMAGQIPRCGVPLANIQSIASSLTDLGFSLVVVAQTDEAVSRGRKRRRIAQVLTPSNPVFTYGLRMETARDATYRESPPIVGVSEIARGLVVCEVFPEVAMSRVSRGLTIEAVKMTIRREAGLPAKVFFHSSVDEATVAKLRREFVYDGVDPFVVSNVFQRVSSGTASAFCDEVERLIRIDLSLPSDFPFDRRTGREDDPSRMRPLYYATAAQIGLVPTRGVPDLVSELLPRHARAGSHSFLRSLLLTPPSAGVASGLRDVARLLAVAHGIPDFLVTPSSRFIKPITTGEVNGELLSDLLHLSADFRSCATIAREAAERVFALSVEQTGVEISFADALEAARELEELVSPLVVGESEGASAEEDSHGVRCPESVPTKIFAAVESRFRGRVSPDANSVVREAIAQVGKSATAFLSVVVSTLAPAIRASKAKLSFDDDNVTVWIKGRIPAEASLGLLHPRDRNGRTVPDRLSSIAVEDALADYKARADAARSVIAATLSETSRRLLPMRAHIMLLNHFATAMKTILLHVYEARRKGWSFDVRREQIESYSSCDRPRISIKGMFPYWLDASVAIKNDIELDGMSSLVGSNMSGKSTICRQIGSIVVLHATGALALPCDHLVEPWLPADSSATPMVDSVWIRMGSMDDPASGLSAFAVEAQDVKNMLAEATSKSMVLIDELGKGCPTRSGAAFAGAILQEMSKRRFYGIFSTHWHELWRLGLDLSRVRNLHMELRGGRPTHKLKDGRVVDSHALTVARDMGLSPELVDVARELEQRYDAMISTPDDEFVPTEGFDGLDLDHENDRDDTDEEATSDVSNVSPSKKSWDDVISAVQSVALSALSLDLVRRDLGRRGLPAVGDCGRSCLYILKTKLGFFYVGESDDILGRVKKHRADKIKRGCEISYFVVENGKSAARQLETCVLRALVIAGFPLLSTNDATHRSFGK